VEAKALLSSGPSNNRNASISTVALAWEGFSYGGQGLWNQDRIIDLGNCVTLQQMTGERDDEMKDEEDAEFSISSQEGDIDTASLLSGRRM
jgi:hypothetical protein